MSLRLAPYTNAMRLGQGFNSFTQQICVDDAVVVDPDRAENVVTNDGTTMRIIAQTAAKPSAWTRQTEVVNDNRAEGVLRGKRLAASKEKAEANVAEDNDEVSTPALPDKVMTSDDADMNKDVYNVAPEAAQKLPGEQSTAEEVNDKSDTDSLEKIATHEAQAAKEAEPTTKDDTEIPADEEAGAADTNTSVPSTAAPLRAHHPTNEASPQPKRRIRSSSQPQIDAKPQNRTRFKGTLTKSQVEEKERKREAEAAERHLREQEEKERIAEQAAYRKELEKEARDEERTRRAEDRKEQQQIREEKRRYETQRREENRKAIADAANLKALTLQDLDKIKAQNQFADRFVGMTEDQDKFDFDPTAPRGPSQTVTYASKFVDRLSDVTDDMSVSGSLSIKAAKIGGSGRGSFVDSDKFKQSDLNFYISVKVINQTINFKDALVYNPLRSVDKANFQEVYGDSFTSGFLEGGEFNAIVSMKILNKAKLTDIKAEAKVAFTAGPIDVTAEANVGIARSNIETNTETTIQVSWCGGGHIKPMEQQWDIQSLMAAASRFPDLVADCPQRTYAILTKYDTLRSFVAQKPGTYTPLQYENAQIYTNALLDSFMSYKALYKKLSEQIFNVQAKTLEITTWDKKDATVPTNAPETVVTGSDAATTQQVIHKKNSETGLYPYVEDLSHFDASIKGLSDARKAIRRQMARIVNEVDLMEKDPKKATDEDHEEPFQSPVTFETRLPDVVVPERLQPKNDPLTGKRIMAKPQTEEELKEQQRLEEEAAKAPALYTTEDDLNVDEKSTFDNLRTSRPGIGQHLRISSGVGSSDKGVPFNNLDFLQEDWEVESIKVEIAYGAVACVEVNYDNGLLLRRGRRGNGQIKELDGFKPGERVAYASIESGVALGSKEGLHVLSVRLYTNHGRRLLGQATKNEVGGPGRVTKDGEEYEQVQTTYVDSPLSKGTFKGFFGRSSEAAGITGGILRLGLIWGDKSKLSSNPNSNMIGATAQAYDYAAQNDAPKRQITYAQSGVLEPSQWSATTRDCKNTAKKQFQPTYTSTPKMISGFSRIDQEKNNPVRVAAGHENAAPTGFDAFFRTFGNECAYAPKLAWLSLPENDVHFETGVFETYNAARIDKEQKVRARLPFSKKFVGKPLVISWLYELSFSRGWHSIFTEARAATEDSFELAVETWYEGRTFDGIRTGWLAFNDIGCTSHVKYGRIVCSKELGFWRKGESVTFEGEAFSKTPAVFFALAQMDAGDDRNLRLSGEVLSATRTGFTYQCGTWALDDHNLFHCEWIWVAVE